MGILESVTIGSCLKVQRKVPAGRRTADSGGCNEGCVGRERRSGVMELGDGMRGAGRCLCHGETQRAGETESRMLLGVGDERGLGRGSSQPIPDSQVAPFGGMT